MRSQSGFTLIEITIVLVIIGLIVGGVLVGRDLIVAAEIRTTLAQIDQYKTAFGAFRNKYGGLPGDLAANDANALGFETRGGTAGSGDSNRLIEACNTDGATGNAEYIGCENVLAWRDLNEAGMIDGNYSWAADGAMVGISDFSQLMPSAKGLLNTQIHLFSKRINPSYSGAGIPPFNMAFRNILGMIRFATTDGSGSAGGMATVSPLIAQAIDSKLDDGLPLSGRVLGVTTTTYFFDIIDPPAAVCHYNDSTPNLYNSSVADRNRFICKMLFVL